MRLRVCTVALIAVFVVGTSAHADSYVQSASLPFSYLQGPSEHGFALQLFNPALGTLNSVTQTLTGTVYFEPMVGATTSEYVIETGPILGTVTEAANETLDLSAVTSGPFGMLEGTSASGGALYLNLPFDVTSTGGYLSTAELTDAFTFNYTPAAVAATPEPSSFLLLGTGLLGAAGVLRRRFV